MMDVLVNTAGGQDSNLASIPIRNRTRFNPEQEFNLVKAPNRIQDWDSIQVQIRARLYRAFIYVSMFMYFKIIIVFPNGIL